MGIRLFCHVLKEQAFAVQRSFPVYTDREKIVGELGGVYCHKGKGAILEGQGHPQVQPVHEVPDR